MSTSTDRGLAIAVIAVFVASILAIAGHAEQVEQGYRLAAARREGEVLRREALTAERRTAGLGLPTMVVQRATAMGLDLGLQRNRQVLGEAQVVALLASGDPASVAPTAATQAAAPAHKPSVNAGTPARRARTSEVRAR